MTTRKAGVRIVPEGRLRLSRAPTSELGAAAMLAQKDTGLDACDFVIVAVEPGAGDDALAAAVKKAVAGLSPAKAAS